MAVVKNDWLHQSCQPAMPSQGFHVKHPKKSHLSGLGIDGPYMINGAFSEKIFEVTVGFEKLPPLITRFTRGYIPYHSICICTTSLPHIMWGAYHAIPLVPLRPLRDPPGDPLEKYQEIKAMAQSKFSEFSH